MKNRRLPAIAVTAFSDYISVSPPEDILLRQNRVFDMGEVASTTEDVPLLDTRFLSESQKDKTVRLIDSFGDLKSLPNGWDSLGVGAISQVAIKHAKDALSELSGYGVCPDRVSPTADDSILFEITSEMDSLLIEFFGTGEVAVVRSSGGEEELRDFDNVVEAMTFARESALA